MKIDNDENHRGSVGLAKKGKVEVNITALTTQDLNQKHEKESLFIDNIIANINFGQMEYYCARRLIIVLEDKIAND